MKEAVQAYLRYLQVERNASEHTLVAYRTDLEQFQEFLQIVVSDGDRDQGIQLSSVDRLKIRLWLGALSEDGLGKTTIARKAASVRSFFRYAIRRGFCEHDPASLLIIPRKEKRIPVVVAQDDISRLLDGHPSETPQMRQDRAILELLYSTGIRVSECTRLNIEDVQRSMKQIQVLGKGRKQRIVPLGETALEALESHLETRSELAGADPSRQATVSKDSGPLFLTPKGLRLYPRAVQRLVDASLSSVSDVPRTSPHVIRHSFATQMLDAGADIRMIKEFLGHSSLAATQVYTHTSVEHLKNIHQNAHPRAKK